MPCPYGKNHMVFFSPFKKKQRKMTPWYALLGLVVVTAAFGLKIYDGLKPDRTPTSDVPAVSYEDIVQGVEEVDEVEEVVEPVPTPTPAPVPTPTPEPVPEPAPVVPAPPKAPPAELNLAVPFTSQAPTGNWDALHEDACEEASFFMATEFYKGRAAGKVDPVIADPELYKQVDRQTALGMGYSISTAEAVAFIKDYYQLNTVVVENPTVEQIKELIRAGKPVIVPAAGRELGNPNFTGAGPLYHMLVIRGYTATTFITNDPGTRNGENYVYTIDVLMNAIGDWNNGDPTNGAKRVFYIEPK